MEEKHILALEIGSSKIKGAAGVIDADGVLTVQAIEEEKILDSVRHGVIINVETVTNHANSIIRKLENRVSPYKVRSVYLGLGGRSFRSSPREIERQFPGEEEITTDIISQMRNEAHESAMSDSDVIDVIDGEFLINRRSMQNPIGAYASNFRARFNLITCRQQLMKNIKRVINERLGIKINDCFVRQLSQADLVLSSDEKRLGCMLVDFGAETTTVSIYRNGALCYLSTIPLGSRNITRDITNLNFLEERAEELKKAGGNAFPQNVGKQIVDGLDFTEINSYVQARASEIIANVNEQIKYAGLTAADLPGGIIFVGGGSKLQGFSDLLSKFTKLKVHSGMPSSTVRILEVRQSAFDSIDVISILAAAAKLDNVVDCMVDLTPKKPVEQTVAAAVPEFNEPVVKVPEPEPEPEPQHETIESVDNDDDVDDFPKPRKPRKISFFTRISNAITNMMSEVEDDDDENDLPR